MKNYLLLLLLSLFVFSACQRSSDKKEDDTATKPDSTEASKEKETPNEVLVEKIEEPANFDAKLLVGTWEYTEKSDDEVEAQFMEPVTYHPNGKYDAPPFTGFANYKLEGNLIKYTKVINDLPDYELKITKLTETELVFDNGVKMLRKK